MCINCFIEAGSPKIENEAVTKAIELINALYETEDGGAGGYGHVVFDDWNTENESIQFCINEANAAADTNAVSLSEECRVASLAALEHFLTLSEDERHSALGKVIDQ